MTDYAAFFLVNATSALLLVLLGVWVVVRRTASPWLGLFLVAWGVPILGTNSAIIFELPWLRTWTAIGPLAPVFLAVFAFEARDSRPAAKWITLAILAAAAISVLAMLGVPGWEQVREVPWLVGTALALLLWSWDADFQGLLDRRVLLGVLVAWSYTLAYTIGAAIGNDPDTTLLVTLGLALITVTLASLRVTALLWTEGPARALPFLLPILALIGFMAPFLPNAVLAIRGPGTIRLVALGVFLAPALMPRPHDEDRLPHQPHPLSHPSSSTKPREHP